MSYADWIKRFSALFGMTSEAGLITLKAWSAEFRDQGVTPDQLNAATTQFFRSGSGASFPADLLRGLQAALDAIRRTQATREPFSESDRICGDCRGSGWVSVPTEKTFHSRTVQATRAVVCRCEHGSRLAAGLAKLRPQTLEEYERDSPGWRDEVARREQECRSRRPKRSRRKTIDTAVDEVVDRIKKRRNG